MAATNTARYRRSRGEAGESAWLEAALLLETAAAERSILLTRGILFRSAGWLAIQAGQLVEAVRLAEEGLRDQECPTWVQDELRDVVDEVAKRLKAERGPVR